MAWRVPGEGSCVYHLLRWRQFLTDPQWQQAMLTACSTLADLLQSPDGVVMSDYHPAYRAFFAGAGYDACLHELPSEGEVDSVAGLYQLVDADIWDSHGYWCFRRRADPQRRHTRRRDRCERRLTQGVQRTPVRRTELTSYQQD